MHLSVGFHNDIRQHSSEHIRNMRQQRSEEAANERTSLLGNSTGRSRLNLRSYPKHFYHAAIATLRSNYVNYLLVVVPFGILAGILQWPPMAIFVLNFIAIIPLASLLSFATEEISLYVGETLGGLLNATFGNAVELIVSIVALTKGEIGLVQASMLGSILSNILLVLGCCFLIGGIHHREQSFNATAASTMSSLMAVSCASLIIPAMLYTALSHSKSADSQDSILLLSRGTAIILLILYVMYLYFQLVSHKSLFEAPKPDVESQDGQTNGNVAHEEDPRDQAILTPIGAVVVLSIITVAVAVCAEYLVDSIEEVTKEVNVSKTFIGLILLPIVGNAAEHVTACIVAYKNKMDLALGVAIGSSMQIAILVTPSLVILGWIIGQPMTLYFEPFVTTVFFVSVLVVNYLIQDGMSNYLEGAMLIGIYTIIAIAFAVYPDDAGQALFHQLGFGSS